jgi:hypothetical protein
MPRLFSLWKIATREQVFPAYDRALKARLSQADYDRYLADPERPVLHHQLRGAQLGGHDVDAVLDRAAGRDMGGARSIAGVLHGRIRAMNLAASNRATSWAERTPRIDDPDHAMIARATAEAMDHRQLELGVTEVARPSPWAVRYLGMPPREPGALRDDWITRAGAAAAYRDLVGRSDPENALGAYPQSGAPEQRQAWSDAARALQMRREEIDVRSATTGELEAVVQAYERAREWEPAHVASDLEQTAIAEVNSRATARLAAAEAAAGDKRARQRQASAEAAAGRLAARRETLEQADAVYEDWHQHTEERRERAAGALAELSGRSRPVPRAPERGPEADSERIAERAAQARAWMERELQAEGPERGSLDARPQPAWHPGEREPCTAAGWELEPEA